MNSPIHPVAVGLCYVSGTALTLFGIGGCLSPPKLFELFVRNLVMGISVLTLTRLGPTQRTALGIAMTGLTAYAAADAVTIAKTPGSKGLEMHMTGMIVYGAVAAYLWGLY